MCLHLGGGVVLLSNRINRSKATHGIEQDKECDNHDALELCALLPDGFAPSVDRLNVNGFGLMAPFGRSLVAMTIFSPPPHVCPFAPPFLELSRPRVLMNKGAQSINAGVMRSSRGAVDCMAGIRGLIDCLVQPRCRVWMDPRTNPCFNLIISRPIPAQPARTHTRTDRPHNPIDRHDRQSMRRPVSLLVLLGAAVPSAHAFVPFSPSSSPLQQHQQQQQQQQEGRSSRPPLASSYYDDYDAQRARNMEQDRCVLASACAQSVRVG